MNAVAGEDGMSVGIDKTGHEDFAGDIDNAIDASNVDNFLDLKKEKGVVVKKVSG